MIGLEHLYKKYFEIYTKTNFINWNNSYVSSIDKLYLYGSLVFYTIGSMLFIFMNMLGIVSSIIYGVVFMMLALLYKKKYDKEFQQKFVDYHNIENQDYKEIDYIFYDAYSYIQNDVAFIKNINYLSKMANLEINREKFLNSSVVILTISAIISIIAGIISTADSLSITKTIIYLIAFILVYNLVYTKNQHFGRNKHASFKLFLLKIDYFNRSVEKIAVMKNNRPEAVMLSVEEYERIKELADMAEHIGLAELIRERKATPKASYIPFEDVMAKAGIAL